jgi:HEAT repeat protein
VAVVGGNSPEALTALADALRDNDSDVRKQAAQQLRRMGDLAVPNLLAALKDPAKDVRRQAAWALAGIGESAQDGVPALTQVLLKDEDPGVRVLAAQALYAIGLPGIRRAAPDLPRALKDENREVCYEVLKVLTKLGPEARETGKAGVAEALRICDKQLGEEALAALKGMRLDAKEYVKYLIGAFRNNDAEVRSRLTAAIKQVGPSAIFPLTSNLDHPQAIVRLHVVMALGEMGTEAGTAIPALQRHLQRELVPEIRQAIIQSIQRINGR